MSAEQAQQGGTGTRGPTPKLQQQMERFNHLPKAKQKVVMEMLDAVLGSERPLIVRPRTSGCRCRRLHRLQLERLTPLNATNDQVLIEKLMNLPPQQRAEVEDFVDFLASRARKRIALDRLFQAMGKL